MSPRPALRKSLRSRAGGRRGRVRGPAVDGRAEAVAEGHAVGWAWDAGDPTARLDVAVEIRGEVVAEGIADIARQDLVAGRIGDGAHGFRLELPESLQRLTHAQIVVLAGPDRVTLPKATSFRHIAHPGSRWSGVRFGYGREGDPEADEELRVEVLPAPDRPRLTALVGRDGWLFDSRELDAQTEPSAWALERLAERIQRTAAAFAEVGVVYVPACVPEKLQAVHEGSPLRLDHERPWLKGLVALLRGADEVEMLDLLPVVQDARRHGRCFQRSDADWNDRAAFFVARALMKEACKRSPTLRPLPMASLHLVKRHGYRGVLADAAKVRLHGDRWLPAEIDFSAEEGVAIDAAHLRAERMPVESHLVGNGDVHVRLFVQPDAGQSPRLSVVGDDACLPLLPWLAQSAPRTTFFWTSAPPMEPVELELPDIVLHLIRYRELGTLAIDQPSSS